MSEDRCQEDQDEEDQRKTSKLTAYLSIKSENCKIIKMRKCNALSNSQIGVLKNPIVHSLRIIRITSNYISVFPRVFLRSYKSFETFEPGGIEWHNILEMLTKCHRAGP